MTPLPALPTLLSTADALKQGRITSRKLVESCLEKIHDAAGEGSRAFIKVYQDAALREAVAADKARNAGHIVSVLSGIPISIKDLFDIAGESTRAGSIFDFAPASQDAVSIARLKAAGAIIIGRANMTEFAYGAHGTNCHYGTPLNPFDRANKRIAGGSTSGGAVSVTDGMALATIGSDTGGSVRIPAALCGLAGYKPTQARVPLAGAFPLSHTRDSIGPLGATAACCVLLDAAMAGHEIKLPAPASLRGLTFGVPTNILFDGLASDVERDVARALTAISRAGAAIREFHFHQLQDELDGSKEVNFSGYEGYLLHQERLADDLKKFDPWISTRLLMGANMRETDYLKLQQLRQKLTVAADKVTAHFDALLAPTVPIIAPTIAELTADTETFYRINSLLLRNTAPFNVFDRPAFSLPCHRTSDAPVGLMVVGETYGDEKLQRIGVAIEAVLQR